MKSLCTRAKIFGQRFTLRGWFVAHVIAAIIFALSMNALFMSLAGIWADPPLEKSDPVLIAAGIAKTLNRVEATQRQAVIDRISDGNVELQWFPDRQALPLPAPDDEPEAELWSKLETTLHYPGAGIITIDPDDPNWREAGIETRNAFYALAIRLEDGSWLLFHTPERLWGLSLPARFALTSLFMLLSTLCIAWIFGLRVARPVRRFAHAAARFGTGVKNQPLSLSGPREVQEAAAAFNAMQTQIQRLIEGRAEMFSAISHDLRAPLTRLRMRSEFIADDTQREKVARDIDQLHTMVEACLAYFRQDLQPEAGTRFELGELLHTLVDDFRDMGSTIGYAPSERVIFHGQPVALKRALTNLLDNAVKYGRQVTLEMHADTTRLRIVVTDEGPGVPEAWLPKLFDPFYRGEPSRNLATGGYGLGLAASRSIVHAHGGELTLANRHPHGLIASVELPRLAPSAET